TRAVGTADTFAFGAPGRARKARRQASCRAHAYLAKSLTSHLRALDLGPDDGGLGCRVRRIVGFYRAVCAGDGDLGDPELDHPGQGEQVIRSVSVHSAQPVP